ncbi:hypothetical protein BJ912DRAFT_964813, partial [Pholiota molesta]
ATTTSTTLETGVEQPPQAPPVLTYSQFLGTFDELPPTMGGVFQPPGLSYRATNSYGFDKFGRARGSPRMNGLTSTVVIENGWPKDVSKREEEWLGHGKIEEVDDDIADVSIVGDDEDDEDDSFEAPRARMSLHNGGQVPNGVHERDGNAPWIGLRSVKASSTRTATAGMNFTPDAGPSSQPVVFVIRENLDLINSSEEDLKFMNKVIPAGTLILRTQIGAEEWSVRSSSWHQKYCKRLISLRTTNWTLAEVQPLRPRQRQAILTKLEQHEAKLADLASKYSQQRLLSRASFERRWKEAKSFRAGLRNDFHDLRQEFYGTQRVGRHISSP